MANMTMIQAINNALDLELGADEKVLIFGEDVGKNGGVFRATEDLQKKHGEDRVFDTPLAESGIGGLSIGLALKGYRPVPEIQFFGFLFEVMDSIAGQMSRIRLRMNGTRQMPITIRSPFGGGVHTPELHSDSLEGLVAQTPGLRVVIPSNPYDAKGLLISSIRSNDPVIYLEHMKLYRSFREEVPEEIYELPLDQANVAKEGTDLTIVSYGAGVRDSLKAAEALAADNINAEVIDLRTIAPLDVDTIVKSVEKTGRLLVVQEAQRQAGVGNQVVSEVSQRAVLSLEAPIGLVAAPDTPYPFSSAEEDWLPNPDDIIAKAKEIANF
ncbi:pyruvate dehydrogenase E1 component subunit beta [Amylolactobacillus amylotrophicus DSM 20534]|uniref:Pyruvate dehydrogenase E1 component subunit beta n=3 Tax=Amylolactobacillus TaxID=2767876 RepID=A0A0R1YKJ8_9LACO|nr:MULTISPECIES: alpha-ketoacid dehydrogenase subunit beta [Amylolactobacillus]APT19125.1 alpha-ketoacid dehydrogenase subunit beta [Amylolactobacillus amylophilus DSM 20533 = JCM 1125]KRK38608.1 pyruvate dehydrogenase E1 component subunit beta [Amylolactobacillus amylotrophicus DSM 20534]KRM42749.1 pyruvate dehydrogenase E1 component subunit beta [Amylolactobacillus amylophilus DSM 20533 = JCM 1125]GED79612.1 2-oxoisovalerate dehydrogenase subunit beta [Amylolactobacillus amylophilus]